MEWMEADRLLMFSTDYPHHDFDHPTWALPRLPKAWRDRIAFQNAMDLYHLPPLRPVDDLDRGIDPQLRAAERASGDAGPAREDRDVRSTSLDE
jgi:hypothetical protein